MRKPDSAVGEGLKPETEDGMLCRRHEPLDEERMKKTLVMISMALVGMAIAGGVGYRTGCNNATDWLLQQEMSGNLINLSTDIKVAEFLKTNQKEKAEEFLENLIDVHVSSLGVQANQKPFAPMRKEILESINDAKTYRMKWTSPSHKVSENLRRGVDAAFRNDNVQPRGGTQSAR